MDTVDVNDGSMADIANNKITTVVAGKYLISLNLVWNITVANKQYFSHIYVNGANVSCTQFPNGTTGNSRAVNIVVYDVGAGIDIEAYCTHQAGPNTPDVIAGICFTYIRATLLEEA